MKRIITKNKLASSNNFLVGLGSVLNIAGNYFEQGNHNSETDEDFNAISSDWQCVGDYLRTSEAEFDKANKEKLHLFKSHD